MGQVHVELLLGRQVIDAAGVPIGRIEEIIAERVNGECRVREIHLGPEALLERLAVSASTLPFLGSLARLATSRRVPWDRLDLSNPERPRLTCDVDDLP
jgi:hypothetical protein